ncbi:hypothetical protein PHYPSEUDO_009258 [Phytophthora pseudosyringae]|uniref:C2H2-type domain-containing protein n=1 Tax=Phytophthora pseudosyringae TaxID=221518 RepID=A0A8T1VFF0_9STRA|nr:hypothetical protein PHYPSEUDO_009258 [Phytophthora pseudosyringae]
MATVPTASKRRQASKQGKLRLPSHKLQCFSVACLDMPHLEFGDKIVLPPCLKIPTPLLFMIRVAGVDIQPEETLEACRPQFCSVQEFSAPTDQVFLPYWLMQNLRVPEGGSVVVTSVVDIPRGVYCRLQPETTSFLDLAADIGPKLLMETALRRYSVLSVNSTIVIEYGSVRYYVRVAELKPASVVSLCGDVDLETDFMPPEGSDPKRLSTGKSTATNENTSTSVQPSATNSSPAIDGATAFRSNDPTSARGYGRRLRDGGYVESVLDTLATSINEQVLRKKNQSSLQKAQKNVRDKQSKAISTDAVAAVAAAATESSVLAAHVRSAQRAFSTPGQALGTAVQPQSPQCLAAPGDAIEQMTEDGSSNLAVDQTVLPDRGARSNIYKCKLCLADISLINMELHTLRCNKNPAYHKFECPTCHEKILRGNENRHRHCPDCTILCDSSESLTEHQRDEHTASCKCTLCGAVFTRVELRDHVESGQCDHALMPCSLCGLAFKKKDMTQHSCMCSSRTERCDGCKSYIKITEFDTHLERCQIFAQQRDSAPLRPNANFKESNSQAMITTKSSNQTAVECAYCLQGGFSTIAAVEHHVLHNCRVAKSFTTPANAQVSSANQEAADQPEASSSEDVDEPHSDEITRPLLAQGRMRRKGDVDAVHSTSSSRSILTPRGNNSNDDQGSPLAVAASFSRRSTPASLDSSILVPPARLAQQAGKLRKPQPRPNPQLQSLSQRTTKSISTLKGSQVSRIDSRNASSGPEDLCISTAGGTSHRALAAAAPRSRTNTRARRRPTATLPAPGRLDKLP